MSFLELLIIAVALSMDAFAVSVCKGLALPQYKFRNSLTAGLYFGTFQALMPLLGYLIGSQFAALILNVGHLVAFAVLIVIGINMIRESRTCDKKNKECSFGFKRMAILSLATSIDAFAIGISFALLQVNIISAVIIIGMTTFIISFAGVKLGNMFGGRYKSKAEFAGGIILIFMGIKILLEHIGIVLF